MSGYLSAAQVDQMLRGINPGRVSQDRDGFSHLQAYDVRAHLNRVFGFARWSADLVDLVALYDEQTETKGGKPAYKTAYRATVRLSVNAPDGTPLATYTEAAVGESTMPDFKRGDGVDMAIKTAESQALKRCAANLGDQWGASLYSNGSTAPLVKRTLVMPEGEAIPTAVDHDAAPVVPEVSSEPTSEPAAGHSPEVPPHPPAHPEQSLSPAPADPVEAGDLTDLTVITEVQVSELRDRVIEALKQSKREASKILAHLQVEAARRKMMQQPTSSPLGEPMTVAALLDGAAKALARKDNADD